MFNKNTPDEITSTRAFRTQSTEQNTQQPRLVGFSGAVASHHYLSALAANNIMMAGGNAVDAGVAAVLVEGVVNPHMHGPAGECPILVAAPGRQPVSINGNTRSPALATVDNYHQRGFKDMPDEGIYSAGVPASFGALLTALQHFGTVPFHRLVEPAIEAAGSGFAMHAGLHGQEKMGIRALNDKFQQRWTTSAAIYCDSGTPIGIGQRVVNPALAAVYDLLAQRSRTTDTATKSYQTVLDEFYRGSVADAIDRFSRSSDGFLVAEDMANFEIPVEAALRVDMPDKDISVYKCDSWCKGPAFLQTLKLMQRFDLQRMGHNSADYLHLFTEATNLAYADREQFYADPASHPVPMETLLSDDYTLLRTDLIDMQQTNAGMRPGDPLNMRALLPAEAHVGGSNWGQGTVHVDVVDSSGLMAAFTPSGGWLGSNEVMPELGFPLGNRAMTFYLQPANHPNIAAPQKQPRTTISPSISTRRGEPWLAFGTMGGDQQDQWQLQFFLNVAVFGMSLQQAIEAAKVSSEHFDGFFAPHIRFPRRLRVEDEIERSVVDALLVRGHEIDLAPMWTEGYMNAVSFDAASGQLEAACDPRGSRGDVFPATALAW